MSDGWSIGGNARRKEVFQRAYASEGIRCADVEPAATRTPTDMARCIDPTLLAPEAGWVQVEQLCREAVQHGFGSVCVHPRFVSLGSQTLRGAPVAVGAVVGFPLEGNDTEIKALEARRCVQLGAGEIDTVIPVGALKNGTHAQVYRDVAAVRRETLGLAVLKVAIECGLLTDEEKDLAASIARDAGADFVTTSTGRAGGQATADDVRLLRRVVGGTMGIKAVGGIQDRDRAESLLAAGANRLGTVSGPTVVAG